MLHLKNGLTPLSISSQYPHFQLLLHAGTSNLRKKISPKFLRQFYLLVVFVLNEKSYEISREEPSKKKIQVGKIFHHFWNFKVNRYDKPKVNFTGFFLWIINFSKRKRRKIIYTISLFEKRFYHVASELTYLQIIIQFFEI